MAAVTPEEVFAYIEAKRCTNGKPAAVIDCMVPHLLRNKQALSVELLGRYVSARNRVSDTDKENYNKIRNRLYIWYIHIHDRKKIIYM